jgi:hypothetical protein
VAVKSGINKGWLLKHSGQRLKMGVFRQQSETLGFYENPHPKSFL